VRIALGLEYDGSSFHGWQSQADGRGVQDAVESAVGRMAGHRVTVISAGRTDSGVHATRQVAHFETDASRPATAWSRGVNVFLPPAIAICWAQPVDDEFHARLSATGRHYTYLLLVRPVRPALSRERWGWYHRPLSLEPMREAASLILGTHDFSAFRAAQCQAKTPVKTLKRLDISREDEVFRFDVHADAFLQHMVRNIIGSLIVVGSGRQPASWLRTVLDAHQRAESGATFAASGLHLTGVDYHPRWKLPPTHAPLHAPVFAPRDSA